MTQKKINIPFSGITRNTDDGTCTDGECMELINARIKNGSVEPVGRPITMKSFDEEYTEGFYHSLAKKYLFIKKNDATLVFYDENFDNRGVLSPDVSGVSDIQFIGNTVCAMTSSGIHYLLFKEGDYAYLGQKPEFEMQAFVSDEKDITTTQQFDFDYTEGITPPKMDYRDVPKFIDLLDSAKNKELDPYRNEGRIAEPICVRAALRMYNGSHICHSPIYVLFPGDGIYSAGRLDNITKVYSGTNGIKITWTLKTFRIKYNVSFDDYGKWKDIITHIDIFASRPFNAIDVELLKKEGIGISSNTPGIWIYSRDVMGQRIANMASSLYLSNSETGYVSEKYLTIPDTTKERLVDDSYSRNTLSAEALFVYNNRLHLGNIKNILFNGFGSEMSILYGPMSFNGYSFDIRAASVKIYTYISTEEEEKVVLYESLMTNPLYPFFIYPDYRATKSEIYAMIADGQNLIYKRFSMYLSKGSGNFAYYMGWGNRDSISPIDLQKGTTISEYDFNNPGIKVSNIEHSPNKLKVSELNNPFYFPPQTTYTPSSGSILSLASNTAAISQGQFGQFPLIVFCSDGIYAMSVGIDVVYNSSSPLSRDACSNPKAVTPIDNAIIFPSEQGLMLLQGSTVKNLSEAINGYLPSSIDSSPVIGKILNIPKLLNAASATRFDDYIKKCHIGYNYQERELIISNTEYPYSYVYSLVYAQWYKTSYSVRSFVNKYPDILALTTLNNEICNLQNNHRTVADIAIVSRPIKLGTLTHKRILQSALRGIVKRSISDLYLKGEPVLLRGDTLLLFKDVGFYVLGSNDAEHFELISGTESIKDIRDIVGKMTKSKAYKYFLFAFVGGVRTDISINYIELIADESFNNRLR